MKMLRRKLLNFLYYKKTIMLIPHTEKGIFSIHLSNLYLVIIGLIFFFVLIFGFKLIFTLQEKNNDVLFYYQENMFYKKQLHDIFRVLPNITHSQNDLYKKLNNSFTILGVSHKNIDISYEMLDKKHNFSYLESIEGKLDNISNYIKGFRNIFYEIPSIFPLVTKTYWFSSPFGYRRHPITGHQDFHPALDIATFPGTPIQATADGKVEYAGWEGGYGIVVFIKHNRGFESRYAHMMRTIAIKGAYVKRGEIIGYVGSTGVSTGYHVHYELRMGGEPINPLSYINLDKF